jgi:hypothetical protein
MKNRQELPIFQGNSGSSKVNQKLNLALAIGLNKSLISFRLPEFSQMVRD